MATVAALTADGLRTGTDAAYDTAKAPAATAAGGRTATANNGEGLGCTSEPIHTRPYAADDRRQRAATAALAVPTGDQQNLVEL